MSPPGVCRNYRQVLRSLGALKATLLKNLRVPDLEAINDGTPNFERYILCTPATT